MAGIVMAVSLVIVAAVSAYSFIDARAVTASAQASERAAVSALPQTLGPSGLPLPRFVSLKSAKVRVRRGPSTQYRVAWVYRAKGLPVEIVAEFEQWRRIRDADGEEGWIKRSLLSGWRTALVAPWSRGKGFYLHEAPDAGSAAVAVVKGGVIGEVTKCTGEWCKLKIGDFQGWIEQPVLWGVYPNERYPAKSVN